MYTNQNNSIVLSIFFLPVSAFDCGTSKASKRTGDEKCSSGYFLLGSLYLIIL